MNRMFIALSLALVSFGTFAGVKVTDLDLKTNATNGFITVSLDGRSNELPDIKVFGKTIEIKLSDSIAFDSIQKNVQGASLSASVASGKAVVKAVLPYEVKSDAVILGWKNKNIEISFPRGKAAPVAAAVVAPAPVKAAPVAESSVKKESLNEDYLNTLMKEEAPKPVQAVQKDEVAVRQAAPVTVNPTPETAKMTDGFSFAGYAAKFTIFLAVVLGLFYGIVQLLKKGVFSKGKLGGFLNNAKMIEVLSTTYVSPKRSLMIIKAHKQIFLVANSEAGLQFLSEMTDTTGLIKEGEKLVTGTNFDNDLDMSEATEQLFKIKENILESAPEEAPKGLAKLAANATDIVKFSDELKKKAKKLKPIEFN
jgi:flagellar biogenesis protein FliO